MKNLLIATAFLSLTLASSPALSTPRPQFRETKCNVRYNNLGIVEGEVSCKAFFDRSGSLSRVKFYYSGAKTWYDWSTSQKSVEKDSRWKECIRLTLPSGNQWQVCTVPSPTELGISTVR